MILGDIQSLCNDRTVSVYVLLGYSVAGVYIVVMVRSRWMRVVWATACRCKLTVPATTSGGPSGDTGERVSLSRALKESCTNLDYRKECLFDCPEFKECCIYV